MATGAFGVNVDTGTELRRALTREVGVPREAPPIEIRRLEGCESATEVRRGFNPLCNMANSLTRHVEVVAVVAVAVRRAKQRCRNGDDGL
jgi:hypothetical protein